MTTVLTDSSNLQGLYEHVKFLTIQDSLKFKDFVRLVNFALDDYTYLALTSTLRWKFDDSTYTSTHPIATHDITGGRNDYELDVDFLSVDQVEVYTNGKWKKLENIDRKDRDYPLSTIYESSGNPQFFDYDGRSIFLYPTPTSGAEEGLKVYFQRPAQYFEVTDTTATIGIPRIHHEYLALHAAQTLTIRTNDKINFQITNKLTKKEKEIRDFYSKRDKTRPRKLKGIINVAK